MQVFLSTPKTTGIGRGDAYCLWVENLGKLPNTNTENIRHIILAVESIRNLVEFGRKVGRGSVFDQKILLMFGQ